MNTMNNKQLKYEKALEYEIFVKEEYSFAKEKIQNAEFIFDIGGHIGLFSKWCRNLNLNAEIHYFEPVREFYIEAKKTLGNDKNIILNNYGIGSKMENGTMLLNQEKSMQSSKYSSFLNQNGKEIKVKFITLKEYLNKNHINKIDVFKMDIEGMEFEVLFSRGNFEREKIDNFVAEIHILNEELELKWNQIFLKIKNIFGRVEIIKSGYREEIFLIYCSK